MVSMNISESSPSVADQEVRLSANLFHDVIRPPSLLLAKGGGYSAQDKVPVPHFRIRGEPLR